MALVASVVATVASATFCRRLYMRWSRGGRSNPALLAWTISLAMFSVASLALLAGVVVGWSSPVFHVFYLFGAVLNVPWLALGSILVNARDAWTTRATGVVTALVALAFVPGVLRGDVLAMTGAVFGLALAAVQWAPGLDRVRVGASLLLVAFTVVATVVVLSGELTGPLPSQGLPEGRELFGPGPRSFAVGGNAVGSIVVIVGALIASARLGWTTLAEQRRGELAVTGRRRYVDALAGGVLDGWRALTRVGLDHIAKGNLLIMAGVVVAAGSGGMFSFLGDTIAHAIGLGVGVVIMYAGFDRTTRPGRRSIPGPVPPSATRS